MLQLQWLSRGVNLQPRFSTQRRWRRCTQGMWLEWVYHPRSRRRSKRHPWLAAAPGRRPSLDCSLATSCWWLLAAVPRLCGLKPPTLQPYKLSYDQTKKHILKREGGSAVFPQIHLCNLPLFFSDQYIHFQENLLLLMSCQSKPRPNQGQTETAWQQ